ncbi:MAG TPA: GNAT family N-acetyltransferase [Lacipirellulaceae bacterium]|jgi:phosphinothricin acetyltransferase|nr:GNAT family N-acetyltransferase [Lacipirellulaceae bacterium]
MTVDIRFAELRDAAGILEIYAPFCESTPVTFELVPPSIEEMRERIVRVSATYPWLVGEANGRILGYVYASRLRERAAYQWTVEVAVYVSPAYQRRGLAHALYTTLFSLLKIQGYFKAFASVSLPNVASVGFHKKLGFHSAGIFEGVGYKAGEWLDVGWWQRELQPRIDSPPDPRPFSQIVRDSAVRAALDQGSSLANAHK